MAASLMVSLPQMVDLALGSPEVGAVNFNLLAAALQVMIQQMKLDEFTVDFRGPDVERMQGILATCKPGMSLKISDPIETDTAEVQINNISPRRSSRDPPRAGSMSKNEKIIVVEPADEKKITTLPQVVVGVSSELFKQIHEDVEDLKNKMNEIMYLPNDDTILEALRAGGQDSVTPVIDMWQALNIAKRMESSEKGVEKLAGMFENLVQQLGGKDGGTGDILADIASRIDSVEQRLSEIGEGVGRRRSSGKDINANSSDRESVEKDLDAGSDVGEILGQMDTLKSRLKTLETDFGNLTKGAKGKMLIDLFRDVDDLKNKAAELFEGKGDDGEGKGGGMSEEAMAALEEKFDDFENKLNNIDETHSIQFDKLNDQLLNIEKELGVLTEAANTKNDVVTDATSMGDLFNKIVKLQDDVDSINKALDKINEEQDERLLSMEALTEQVELLKTTKADREDLEDALADKADTQQVNRKVSAIQFDAACEDLTRHIEDTMKKLTDQEELWQTALDELHLTIGAKLDKQEFDPLREFVNKKIKSLQQRLKALLAMKQEQEAAGTKSKILKNVNCISCDNDVIMYKDNKFATFPTATGMPGTRSIKPYITYELDAVRKQQRSLPQARNMNYLESALHDEKPKKEKPPVGKGPPAGHLCNRYCGGSHTMTQPQQRVAHIGHFLNQWGPQAVSLDEGTIMGKDGQMYKARDKMPESPKGAGDPAASRKLSAQMQTEETTERIHRMSSQIESIKKPRKSGELEPVKEEKDDKKSPTKKSSSMASAGKGSSSSRPSQKKSQSGPKRVSKKSIKTSEEAPPPAAAETSSAEAPPPEESAKSAASEVDAAPAPEGGEAASATEESAAAPPESAEEAAE